MNLTARIYELITAGGVPIVGLTIGDDVNKATWKVQPTNLQSAAQPIIDAFNAADPAHDLAQLDTQVANAMDKERLFSAIVWAVIDTYSPPATIAKFNVARTKIVNAFKTHPWAP